MKYPSLLRRYVASLIDGATIFVAFALYMRSPLRFAQSQAPNYWPLVLLPLYEPLLTRCLCTPGQFLMRIRVRTEPGIERVPVVRTFFRLVVKYVLGLVSFAFMPAHPQKRALHDLAAGTIVVDARSVTHMRAAAHVQELDSSASAVPMQQHFPKWLIAGLLVPLPSALICFFFLLWAALPRASPLLSALVLAMLALGLLACVMLPIAINKLVRKRAELSARNVAQVVPAALASLAFIGFVAYVYYRA
jgi:uncharacterized RDD family membrane protein YckC